MLHTSWCQHLANAMALMMPFDFDTVPTSSTSLARESESEADIYGVSARFLQPPPLACRSEQGWFYGILTLLPSLHPLHSTLHWHTEPFGICWSAAVATPRQRWPLRQRGHNDDDESMRTTTSGPKSPDLMPHWRPRRRSLTVSSLSVSMVRTSTIHGVVFVFN